MIKIPKLLSKNPIISENLTNFCQELGFTLKIRFVKINVRVILRASKAYSMLRP